MKQLRYALVAAVALGGLAAASSPASALPNDVPEISTAARSDVQDVHWVCGPYRCWWHPNWYGYDGGGPGWEPGWGWRHWGWHHSHHWHHWGWNRW
jgi:hypothetical protein